MRTLSLAVSLWALLAALGPAHGAPSQASVAVVLRGAALVTSPVIHLGDCAEVRGPQRLRDVVVAASPPPGQLLLVTSAQVRSVLAGLGLLSARVEGAPACSVTVPLQVLRGRALEEDAVASLRAQLGPVPLRGGTYVLEVLTHPGDVPAPLGSRVAGPVGPLTRHLGVVTVVVGVRWGDRLYRSVPVAVRVAVRAPVLVAARALPYHVVLGPEDVRVEARTLESDLAGLLQDPAQVSGQWTVQAVPAGAVLTGATVAPAPAVRRGSLVTVVVRSGTLWVAATGHAVEDALRGQAVDVEVDATHKVVRGTVVGPDQVELTVPGGG